MGELGKSLLKCAEEALKYVKGQKGSRSHKVKVPKRVDVRLIRHHLHMTRQDFAAKFGFSIRTLEKWERGERCPEGSARAYLTVIANNPKAVRDALR